MRIRTIKPSFWAHPVLARLPDAAKLLAIGLLNLADDEGFFHADPRLVRAALRPFDEDSTITRESLENLAEIGYLEMHDHPTHGPLGVVCAFQEHQRIDRPAKSGIRPLFEHAASQPIDQQQRYLVAASSTNDRRTLDDQTALEGKGREGKGVEEEEEEEVRVREAEAEPEELQLADPTKPAPAPIAWSPTTSFTGITDEHRERWKLAFPACDIDRQFAQMDVWLTANPREAKKSNWLRFITAWLKREQDRGGDARSDRRSTAPPGGPRPGGNPFQLKKSDHSKGF